MLHGDRHKRARIEGMEARRSGLTKNKNKYTNLGKFAQVYASIWDAGWVEEDKILKVEAK